MSTTTPAAVHEQVIRATVAQMAAALQAEIGQRPVAYVTGNRSPKVVGRWARGEGTPQTVEAEQRLRGLYRAYLTLRGPEDARLEAPATIRNWLLGANPHLEERPPIELLRDGDATAVRRAAEEFVRD